MSGLTWIALIRQLMTERNTQRSQKCGAEKGMMATARQRMKQDGMMNQKRPSMS